ncbi:MAG: cellulase [Limisphaerales bacterium]
MKTVFKFHGVIGLVMLVLVCSAPAQSPASQPPPSELYLWRNVVMGGGGFVTGIIFHPRQKGLMYARTDVGGAYRWDESVQRWLPLTDWIGMADVNFTGIDSLAVDPNDPQRVYLAAGTYSGWANGAVLCSDDQGRTFRRTDMPLRMGGNESGRFNGERLAVDPNQGVILFFGSRRDGLWKSADRGATWQKVEGFPNIITTNRTPSTTAGTTTNSRLRFGGFGQQAVGIVSVVFDPASGKPGSPTPTLYAAAATTGTNLFCTTDGGVTWLAVSNQPVGLRPNHLVRAPDGMFYLSYGKEPGPNTMTDGAIWKFNPKGGVWTDITPVHPKDSDQPFGYGCVAVDAQHPSTIMATTFCHWKPHDEIVRSTNGGASWTQLWTDDTKWDHSSAPYTATRTPHWMGTIVINPFNSDQVLFTTGYGIWCCTNATAADAGKPTQWVFLDQGLEETVPLALISPPAGAHLISGVGDIDGFRHDTMDVSPVEGTFAGPRLSSTRDLAFAASKPEVMVRIGNGGRDLSAHAILSEDGGRTWEALASDPPGESGGQGRIVLSADGRTIVWALQRGSASFTTSRGATWTNCEGLSSGISVVADPVNAKCFYAFDEQTGKLMASTNSAVTFEPTAAVLPGSQGAGRGGGVLAATPGRPGDLWVGSRGIGLYHSTDGGASFTRLNKVGGVDALGFGKAAPGKTFPALYLLGNIEQLHAYYRSDDDGQTWVRINDDQHQFGVPNRPIIIGDPRIYGRVYLTTGGRGVIYGDPAPNSK